MTTLNLPANVDPRQKNSHVMMMWAFVVKIIVELLPATELLQRLLGIRFDLETGIFVLEDDDFDDYNVDRGAK